MSKISAIWLKEFRTFWYSFIAYIVIAVFIGTTSWLYFRGLFVMNDANLGGFFASLPALFLLIMPALTMRQWAEEHKTGTIELLMTLPVREWELVLGKYLASVSFLVVLLLLTLPLTLTTAALSQNGLDWGVVITSYLGTLLMGAAYLAMGGWVSSFTTNQIVAFILGAALIGAAVLIGESVVTMFVSGWMSQLLSYLGLSQHFQSIMRGVIDSRDVIYYASIIFLFLYLTVRAVENRKWS